MGACIAKIHCCSDDDSDQTLIQYSIEEAINEVLDGREVDFVITERSNVVACIEVKSSEATPSKSLRYLAEATQTQTAIQLVQNLSQEADHGRVKVRRLTDWLAKIAF